MRKDPHVVDQFSEWFQGASDDKPWLSVVSLLNPHDIAWYPVGTKFLAPRDLPAVFRRTPPNFETPDQLAARGKPTTQRVFQHFEDLFGTMPFAGDGFESAWAEMLNAYLYFQQAVDAHIGHVLDRLNSRPNVAEKTIVIFTSDHGEYAGSHGLRGKGSSAYDESIHVPLFVKDPTGRWGRRTRTERRQLTSSVDLFGLLLTLASGGNAWRSQPKFDAIAHRPDLAAILRDPSARGRDYVLHTTDEIWIDEFMRQPLEKPVPTHVVGYRTQHAKFVNYSHWKAQSIEVEPEGIEAELYEYSTPDGRSELANELTTRPELARSLREALERRAIPQELRRPLSPALQEVQKQAFADFFRFAAAPRSGKTLLGM
jgi:hypothetical protein